MKKLGLFSSCQKLRDRSSQLFGSYLGLFGSSMRSQAPSNFLLCHSWCVTLVPRLVHGPKIAALTFCLAAYFQRWKGWNTKSLVLPRDFHERGNEIKLGCPRESKWVHWQLSLESIPETLGWSQWGVYRIPEASYWQGDSGKGPELVWMSYLMTPSGEYPATKGMKISYPLAGCWIWLEPALNIR